MVGWILKRTALIFISWLGAILLIMFGFGSCVAGASSHSTVFTILGVILLFGGIFLAMFSKALGKWIQIK